MNKVLITGATGNLGSRTLVEILSTTEHHCVLLVYAKNQKEAVTQVRSSLLFWGLQMHDYVQRIEIIVGDITHPKLGFSDKDYVRLETEITHVIHCAANFKLNLSLSDARKSILEATKNVVALVAPGWEIGTFKHFSYISSLDAAGTMEGSIPEAFLSSKERSFLNTYQQAKAETEVFLEELYINSKFPVTIYRPSMLVGESTTGKIINPQSMYHIIKDMLLQPDAKVLPGKDFVVNPMPIDLASKTLCVMLDDVTTVGKTYHLVSDHDKCPKLPDFIAQVRSIYVRKSDFSATAPKFISPWIPYMLVTTAYHLTFGKVRAELKDKRNLIKYFFIKNYPENENFSDYLEQHDLTIPNIQDYLPVLCEYMIKTKKDVAALHEAS